MIIQKTERLEQENHNQDDRLALIDDFRLIGEKLICLAVWFWRKGED